MEEQKIRLLVLGLYESDVFSFIKSVDETEYVHADPNPNYVLPSNPRGIFGQMSLSKSVRLQLFGLAEWMDWFSRNDLLPFMTGIHGFIILINSSDPVSLANFQPILMTVRSYRKIWYSLIAYNQEHQNALDIDHLREILHLKAEETLIPCDAVNDKDPKVALLSIFANLSMEVFVQPTNDNPQQN